MSGSKKRSYKTKNLSTDERKGNRNKKKETNNNVAETENEPDVVEPLLDKVIQTNEPYFSEPFLENESMPLF